MRSAKWPLIKRLVQLAKIEAEHAWAHAAHDGVVGTAVEDRVRQAVAAAVLEDDAFWNEVRDLYSWPAAKR